MQTNLAQFIKDTPEGETADAILRSCVHCGFCLATCPTYQLTGDELDSPRGRIYLMKQMLEGQSVTEKTQLHLDRCLTCRACETACPSGVRYGELVDISRGMIEKQVKRSISSNISRYVLRKLLLNMGKFSPFLKLAQVIRPILPKKLKRTVATTVPSEKKWPSPRHSRQMIVLDGCVQPTLAPNINAASASILDKLGISLIKVKQSGCCGAISYHLNAQQEGLNYMRRNIDAWWPLIQQKKAEAIVITASGCGVTVKEYGRLLSHDPLYAEKAAEISLKAKDISEIMEGEFENLLRYFEKQPSISREIKLSFHSPCTLQHGMQIRGVAEKILLAAGFKLSIVPDAHLCCGSAGTYSILQPELSQQLLKNKLIALQADKPEQIVTANIGCLLHLQSGTSLVVTHWIEVLDAHF